MAPLTSAGRRSTAPLLFAVTGALLCIPAALAAVELRKLGGYGWPGPYTYDISAMHAGESLWKVQVLVTLCLLVLIAATVAAGFAARAAGQRVWRVCVIGALATTAVVTGAALSM